MDYKYINSSALEEMIVATRVNLQNNKQKTDISPLQENISLINTMVIFVLSYYEPSNSINNILEELTDYYCSYVISSSSLLKKEDIRSVLNILFKDKWNKIK